MPLTLQLAETALVDILPQHRDIKPENIVNAVAKECNLSVDRLLSAERSREVALPRQVAMYLMRETNISLPQIGQVLGGRDHTTVMYAIEKINGIVGEDQNGSLSRMIGRIRQQLYA
jgi:chromosomal replication initiator protein